MKNSIRQLQKIIQQAIDIHVHIGPEIIPRKYNVFSLIKEESGKIGGCVLKNHFYPTSPFIKQATQNKLQLFGGMVLNNFVGGLNPEAVYGASLVSDKPFIVWFPTINAKNFLRKSEYEIAPEWTQSKTFKGRTAKSVNGITILKKGQLTNDAIAVLEEIKQANAVLATGHISARETEKLIEKASQMKIKKIVITHPIYQRINMTMKMQKKFADLGCFIEQSYSMYSIDKISMKKIAKQIRNTSPKSVILSSDVGQPFSPSPSESLLNFSQLLLKEGFTTQELNQMMVINPKKLLGIE